MGVASVIMPEILHIYGSENPKDRGKVHIANDYGFPLCGVKILWGECTATIDKIIPEENRFIIYVASFLGRNKDVSRCYAWEHNTCKKCEKKLKELYKI